MHVSYFMSQAARYRISLGSYIYLLGDSGMMVVVVMVVVMVVVAMMRCYAVLS